MSAKLRRRPPAAAPAIYWPRDIETLLTVSSCTRWRMEKDGRLPPRDAFLGGAAVGWHRPTIEAALRGESAGAQTAA